jgi:predicted TIM-barrel fold metal-dependent hydrolase
MNFIDAHVHVWTPDTLHYPLARGYRKEDTKRRAGNKQTGVTAGRRPV